MKNPQTSSSDKNRFFEDDELPEGWILKSFMDVFDIEGGTQPPKSTFVYEPQPNYVHFLQIRDFGERPHPTYIRDEKKLKKCVEIDILIGRYGASVGRICTGMKGAYNVALAKVIIPDEMDRRFVFFLLQSNLFQEPILEIERSAQNGFNKGDLKSIYLPIPPLAEQQRIVARVEALLTHTNAARDRLSRVPLIMKKFRQAVLAAACSGRLTEGWREENPSQNTCDLHQLINTERQIIVRGKAKRASTDTEWMQKDEREIPEQWLMVQINDILHYQRSAGYGVLQPGTETPDGIPMVRVCDILDGKVLVNQLKRISPDIESQYKRTRLDGGEVLVTIVGTIGRTAVVPKDAKGSNVARAVAVLPLCSHVDPEYISYCLTDSKKNIELVDLAREVARKTLNLGLLKAVEIPLPPLAEQHEIVRRVGLLFERADAFDQEVAAAGRRCERLTQAVLGKAFRGEFTTHDSKVPIIPH